MTKYRLWLILSLFSFVTGQAGCKKDKSILTNDESSKVKVDTVFPDNAIGNLVRTHLKTAMGTGENAEAGSTSEVSSRLTRRTRCRRGPLRSLSQSGPRTLSLPHNDCGVAKGAAFA